MTTPSNQSDNKEPNSSGELVPVAAILAFGVGFGLLQIAELVCPSLSAMWQVGPSFIGLICAAGISFPVSLFIGSMRFRQASMVAVCAFFGLFTPWLIHFITKLWEFLRGGGI